MGWSIAEHMRTSLVEDALHQAVNHRESLSSAIMHTDHGRQYTSSAFQERCLRFGVVPSMGRIGSSADNALAESVNASLKREMLQGAKRWSSAAACRRDVFRWIVRYNTSRRHSALAALRATMARLLTWDRAIELAGHKEVAAATGMSVYFADPHSPWQCGTNENTNRWLRQYFPKKTTMNWSSQADLDQVAGKLNNRPRKVLNYETPAEQFEALLR